MPVVSHSQKRKKCPAMGCTSSARCAWQRCRKIVTLAIVMCVITSVKIRICHQAQSRVPLARKVRKESIKVFSVVNSGDQSSLWSINRSGRCCLLRPSTVAALRQWGRVGGDSGVDTRLARHIGELSDRRLYDLRPSAIQGIRGVLSQVRCLRDGAVNSYVGSSNILTEYPLDSMGENRWFDLRQVGTVPPAGVLSRQGCAGRGRHITRSA